MNKMNKIFCVMLSLVYQLGYTQTSKVLNSVETGSQVHAATSKVKMKAGYNYKAVSGQNALYQIAIVENSIGFISPDDGVVGQYNKIEFGVATSDAIQTSIDNFFGNNGYGNSYNTSNGNINPYDPDQISIEATFTYLDDNSIAPQVVYGFYYREYAYSSSNINVNTQWVENTNLENHWRVRFAPKYTGTWKVNLLIRKNGAVVFSDATGTLFTCVSSNNKGFLKLGANKKFFKYENGEAVFPVGLNVCWPKQSFDGDNTKYRPIEYTDYRRTIEDVATGGVNYCRLMFTPFSFQIEWEKLNVYDKAPGANPKNTDRQCLMWEFDKVLETAKDKNLLLHVVNDVFAEGLKNHWTGYFYNWDNNPYKTGDVSTIDDYFSKSSAINVYKKRIRYMIARWGYSTNIADYEITNEANFVMPLFTNPDDAYGNNLVTNWHNEIATYIKTQLNHKDHLISGDYDDLGGLTGIGYLSSIDFTSRHPYRVDRKTLSHMYGDINFFVNKYDKPCMVAEYGTGHYTGYCLPSGSSGGCNNAFVGLIDIVPATFHNALWGGSFTGSPTSTLDWWAYDGGEEPQLLPEYPKLKSFFEGIDMDDKKFVGQRFIGNNDLIEAFMLVSNNGVNATEILGWTHNKSYYYFNFLDPSCEAYDAQFSQAYLQNFDDHYFPQDDDSYTCPQEGQLGNVTVNGAIANKTYGIDWYNTYTGAVVRTDLVSSNGSGVLTITPPVMENSTHDYAYKIRVFNGPCSNNDRLAIAKLESGAGKQALVLNNRCNQANGAVRSINLSTNEQSWVNHGIDQFDGWLDDADKMFIGDVNGDHIDEMILVNTNYTAGAAIRAIDIKTGANIAWINHGTFSGWMDAGDKMFLGDVNDDDKADLVLVNTSYANGAIRAIDLTTGGNIVWINHGTFGGWMDASDNMFLGDVNDDDKADLVLVNTTYANGAIRAIDLASGGNITWIDHSDFEGWMDASDKMFLGDVNADNKADLVLVNTSYSSGAIRVIDLSTTGNIAWVMHTSSLFQNWMDPYDKMLLEDVNGDNKKDLVFANTDYEHGYLKAYSIVAETSIGTITTGPFEGWLDCADRMLVGDVNGNGNNEVVLVNSVSSDGAFLAFDFVANQSTIKYHSEYSPGLSGWKDGWDDHSVCFVGIAPIQADFTKVDQYEEEKTISVFPNPSTGIVNISGVEAGSTIKVCNVLGAVLFVKKMEQTTTKIDCSSLANGIYFIQMLNADKIINERILIEK